MSLDINKQSKRALSDLFYEYDSGLVTHGEFVDGVEQLELAVVPAAFYQLVRNPAGSFNLHQLLKVFSDAAAGDEAVLPVGPAGGSSQRLGRRGAWKSRGRVRREDSGVLPLARPREEVRREEEEEEVVVGGRRHCRPHTAQPRHRHARRQYGAPAQAVHLHVVAGAQAKQRRPVSSEQSRETNLRHVLNDFAEQVIDAKTTAKALRALGEQVTLLQENLLERQQSTGNYSFRELALAFIYADNHAPTAGVPDGVPAGIAQSDPHVRRRRSLGPRREKARRPSSFDIIRGPGPLEEADLRAEREQRQPRGRRMVDSLHASQFSFGGQEEPVDERPRTGRRTFRQKDTSLHASASVHAVMNPDADVQQGRQRAGGKASGGRTQRRGSNVFADGAVADTPRMRTSVRRHIYRTPVDSSGAIYYPFALDNPDEAQQRSIAAHEQHEHARALAAGRVHPKRGHSPTKVYRAPVQGRPPTTDHVRTNRVLTPAWHPQRGGPEEVEDVPPPRVLTTRERLQELFSEYGQPVHSKKGMEPQPLVYEENEAGEMLALTRDLSYRLLEEQVEMGLPCYLFDHTIMKARPVFQLDGSLWMFAANGKPMRVQSFSGKAKEDAFITERNNDAMMSGLRQASPFATQYTPADDVRPLGARSRPTTPSRSALPKRAVKHGLTRRHRSELHSVQSRARMESGGWL